MRIGVFTVLYQSEPLADVLDRLAALGVEAVEIGVGGHPGSAHCDVEGLLADPARALACRRWARSAAKGS